MVSVNSLCVQLSKDSENDDAKDDDSDLVASPYQGWE